VTIGRIPRVNYSYTEGICNAISELVTPRSALRLQADRKQPGFALIAVIVLGLGIGGSTAAFSVLYQAILKPPPYPDAKRLLFVHNFFPKNQVSVGGVSAFDYAEIRRHTDVFASAGIFYWNDLTLTGLGDARHINVVNASATLFDVLGVNPQFGRTFSEAEDQYGAPRTTLLSDGLWRSTFGADPNVLGQLIARQRTSMFGIWGPYRQKNRRCVVSLGSTTCRPMEITGASLAGTHRAASSL
jgi:MacB-like periplasmic core domain